MPPEPDRTERALEALVARALERHAAGVRDPAAELRPTRPELAARVERALELAARLRALHTAAVGRDELIGARVAGRFVPTERLGIGPNGAVYRADDLLLRDAAALKVFRDRSDDPQRADPRAVRRIQALDHPALARLRCAGVTAAGRPFVALELVEGETLAALARAARRGLDPEATLRAPEALRWLVAACDGIEALHRAGLAHGSIKPSNLAVSGAGRAVWIDLGRALAPHPGRAARRADVHGLAVLAAEVLAACAWVHAPGDAASARLAALLTAAQGAAARPRPRSAAALGAALRAAIEGAPVRPPPGGRLLRALGSLGARLRHRYRAAPDGDA